METKHILFIVSDPVDIILTQMVFRDSQIDNELSIVSTQEQALKFIRREPPYESEQRPDLIIIDLNSNNVSIEGFVKEVKDSREFKRIPIIVFTFHTTEESVTYLYDLNVNCCVKKPVDLEDFTKVVENIERFWLSAVKFQRNTKLLDKDKRSY
jgi:chemotaxis family two-component system response regulator Rcp1